jgi:hypothetical protein
VSSQPLACVPRIGDGIVTINYGNDLNGIVIVTAMAYDFLTQHFCRVIRPDTIIIFEYRVTNHSKNVTTDSEIEGLLIRVSAKSNAESRN